MNIYDLPVELLVEIAAHIAQQSGLDLLTFSRTSSIFRNAARRAGCAELLRHEILLDGEKSTFPDNGTASISPMLQSCIQPLPELDFPVTKWRTDEPFNDYDAKRPILLSSFGTHDHAIGSEETCYAFDSSLVIRSIHKQSVQLWDLHNYPPKSVELHFARRITSDPHRFDCGSYVADWNEDDEVKSPGVRLRTIALGEVRVVFATTLAERTIHLIDAAGQPYLAWRIESSSQQMLRSYRSYCEERHSSALCASPEWHDFEESGWMAARLPRPHAGDEDPGILFYNRPYHAKCIQWVSLLTRPDRSSSEQLASGELDLAWMASTKALSLGFWDFRLRLCGLAADGTGPIVQIQWREKTHTQGSSGARPSPRLIRLLHFPLHLIADLTRKEEAARSQVAMALLETASQEFSPSDDHFLLAEDGLKLYALLTVDIDGESAILTIFSRTRIEESWHADATVELQADGHKRIVGVYEEWLVLADDWNGSVRLLRTTDSVPKTFQMLPLDPEANTPAREDAQSRTPKKKKREGISISLLAGRVLCTHHGSVKGLIELTTDQEPYLVDLEHLMQLCSDDNSGDGILLPKQRADRAPSITQSGNDVDTGLFYYKEGFMPFPHLRLARSDTERPLIQADVRSTKPLFFFIWSTCPAQSWVNGNTGAIHFEPVERLDHVILLKSHNRAMEVVHCKPLPDLGQASCPAFNFKAAVSNHLLVNHYRDVDCEMNDEPSMGRIVDLEMGHTYHFRYSEASLVLDRLSNSFAPSLIFATSKKPGTAASRFFQVRLKSRAEQQANGNKRLYNEIERAMDEEVEAIEENTGDMHDWRGFRPLPNWLLDYQNAVFIGGVKRLLAFLTTPAVGL